MSKGWASGCAQSVRAFNNEYGRKITSINQWFTYNFPSAPEVQENPILVLGIVCVEDVDGRPTRVVENRFETATDDLIRSIKEAGAN
ncbi:MAG: hypothetical protein AAGA34_10595 [Pseudomonadota bacterium]